MTRRSGSGRERISSVQESRDTLFDLIMEKGRLSFADIREYERRPDVFFGPGIDVVDILTAGEQLGRIVIDINAKEVRAVRLQET